MIEQVPEFADGGYWYVVPATPMPETEPGWTFEGFTAGCAWYADIDGTMMVAVRTPDPVAGIAPASPDTVSEVLQAAGESGKPFGRIGGR